jgi:phosphatidate cytidylyltransferase
VASLITRGLQLAKPQSDFSELKLRIRSWWYMAGFFFASLIISPHTSLFLFALLSFLALKEYFTMIHTRLEDHRAMFWAFLAIPVQYWWVFTQWKAMILLFIPVYMFLFIPFRLILVGQPKGIIDSMARIQWGLMAFVYCISYLGFITILPATESIPGGGKALLLYLVFLTEMNDVCQYVFGKLFGKRKIVPTISPNKTWEGFLGGFFSTLLLAQALRFLSGFSMEASLAAGAIISASGFIGDVVISAVKRDIGVKDSSTLIPGHGGMLDRVDSLAYTAPLFFHFTNYFFYHQRW